MIPQDEWRAAERRVKAAQMLMKLGIAILCAAGGLQVVDTLVKDPRDFTVFVRFVVPMGLIAWASYTLGKSRSRRHLETLRQLLIKHVGFDPGPPP